MTTRQAIADALNTAAIAMGNKSIAASPKRPTVLGPGVAWPQTTGWDRADGQGYTRNWSIFIVLLADEVASVDWLDNNLGDVDDALRPVVFVDRYEPVVIPADADGGNNLYGCLITAHSE